MTGTKRAWTIPRRDASAAIRAGEPGALDLEQRVLAAKLIALRRELLGVIPGHGERGRLGHIDERENETQADRRDGEGEDAQIP